jgi:hypothetical protein
MRRHLLMALAAVLLSCAIPCAAQFETSRGGANHIGFAMKTSTLGGGMEVAAPLTRWFNVRGGYNWFHFNRGFENDGIHYFGAVRLQSGEAHLDWFPFAGGFHLSAGALIYNQNRVQADAVVPGGQTFSLGGTTYRSDPANPVFGGGKIDFQKVAPTLTLGWGNLLPRSGKHFSVPFEMGVVFQGSPKASIALNGNVCDSTGVNCRNISTDAGVQSDIQAQQVNINHDLAPFRYYPILSLGFSFNF